MKMRILAAAVICVMPFSAFAQGAPSGKGNYAGGPRGEEMRRGSGTVVPRARAGRVQVRRGRVATPRRGVIIGEPRGTTTGKGNYAGGPLGAERRR